MYTRPGASEPLAQRLEGGHRDRLGDHGYEGYVHRVNQTGRHQNLLYVTFLSMMFNEFTSCAELVPVDTFGRRRLLQATRLEW